MSDKLQKLQNRAARVITKLPFDTSSNLLLATLKRKTLPLRCKKQDAVIKYKTLNELAPEYLQCFFTQRHVIDCNLRANVGIYRESQISSEKSNFGLYHPNNPLVWLFQKMILKNPQALCIWIILKKFENSQKNAIFIHEISHNFERIQRHSTGAKDLLLTSSSSHV